MLKVDYLFHFCLRGVGFVSVFKLMASYMLFRGLITLCAGFFSINLLQATNARLLALGALIRLCAGFTLAAP